MKLNKRTAALLETFHTDVHAYASRQHFSASDVNRKLLADMQNSKLALKDHLYALEERLRNEKRYSRRLRRETVAHRKDAS